MVDEFRFSGVPALHFGPGVFKNAVSVVMKYGRSLLLVAGSSSFTGSGRGRGFVKELKEKGLKIDIVNVEGEPHAGFIDGVISELRVSPPGMVLAVGGGSVLDAGKALAAMLTVEGRTWDYLEGNPEMKAHPGTRLPLIAVPTTAGTGSEATRNAVLTTPGEPRLKRSLRHDNFVPDLAIVDPLLTTGCPPHVTAASGLDAITQLLEALVSTGASPVTDALAKSGLQCGIENLERAVSEGNDINARTGMAYAAFLSGIVLSNAGLGAVHGFASVLGGYYDIPHGVVCGTLLGAVTRVNIGKLAASEEDTAYLDKYAAAGMIVCSEKGRDRDHYLARLADELDRMVEVLNIPRLGCYGVTAGDITSIAAETAIKNNPASLTTGDLEKILLSRL